MKTNVKSLLTIAAVLAAPFAVLAQDTAKPKESTTGGERRDRGNFNPEEFRKRMEDRIKSSLKVTDDEWSVLQPLITKVTDKQRDASTRSFGFGGPGGPGGTRTGGTTGGTTAAAPTDGRAERAGTAERAALSVALENESTTPEELKKKLGDLRAVHGKAVAELATAREDLRKVVTVRQEAVLVSMGILE